MLKTEHGANNIHLSKIILFTIHELTYYLTNSDFRNYLSSKSIHIEHNSLGSIFLYNVGFLEQITSSLDTPILHKIRLRDFLPKNAPKFQGRTTVNPSW
jgi:hypothetical protein